MKSQITHEEINEAIIQFVRQRYNPDYLEGKEITVELTAGRSNGNSASIDIKPRSVKHELTYEHNYAEVQGTIPSETLYEESEPQTVGDVTEVEPTIPDDTPVLHTDF